MRECIDESEAEMLVVELTHPDAPSPEVTGAKAANIARCARAGLPTLPGFALTTEATARGLTDPDVLTALRTAWLDLGGGTRPVVVRSSSTIEDAGASSMAGRFTSVLDVVTWDELVTAAQRVVDSADAVRDDTGERRPIGVLVQPQLDTDLGGVMFGVDPVTGDTDHVVVEAVAARPEVLVSGTATADHYVLSPHGRVLEHATVAAATTPVRLDRSLRRRLVRMAALAAEEFGSPQDVEWAVDRTGRLWLLQSRPVTAVAARDDERAVVMGAGPVAETFPAPLCTLEQDLWIEALRDGVTRALLATGAVSEAAVAASPVVTTIDGWAAVDLELLGVTTGRTGLRRRFSLAAIVRRLSAAWRVGRLRVALPQLAATVVDTVDHDLEAIAPLGELTPETLVDLLRRSRRELATVHSYEVLCGMLLHDPHSRRLSAAASSATVSATRVALGALVEARRRGDTDAAAIARDPVLLSLSAPSMRHAPLLPAEGPHDHPSATVSATIDNLPLRDALRLRARWIQELQCRVMQQLDRSLAPVLSPTLPADADHQQLVVVHLTVAELGEVVSGGRPPADLATRVGHRPGPPLPTSFRIGATGRPITGERHHRDSRDRRDHDNHVATGLPAGGGRGTGVVVHEPLVDVEAATMEGRVLVTQHLGPHLAGLLPHLDGLVSETGSALSHVAILAREMGVPTVAGVAGARRRFRPGVRVVVDGTAGTVERVGDGADIDAAGDAA